jgi:hypothetical protein
MTLRALFRNEIMDNDPGSSVRREYMEDDLGALYYMMRL